MAFGTQEEFNSFFSNVDFSEVSFGDGKTSVNFDEEIEKGLIEDFGADLFDVEEVPTIDFATKEDETSFFQSAKNTVSNIFNTAVDLPFDTVDGILDKTFSTFDKAVGSVNKLAENADNIAGLLKVIKSVTGGTESDAEIEARIKSATDAQLKSLLAATTQQVNGLSETQRASIVQLLAEKEEKEKATAGIPTSTIMLGGALVLGIFALMAMRK